MVKFLWIFKFLPIFGNFTQKFWIFRQIFKKSPRKSQKSPNRHQISNLSRSVIIQMFPLGHNSVHSDKSRWMACRLRKNFWFFVNFLVKFAKKLKIRIQVNFWSFILLTLNNTSLPNLCSIYAPSFPDSHPITYKARLVCVVGPVHDNSNGSEKRRMKNRIRRSKNWWGKE